MAESKVKILEEYVDKAGNRIQKYLDKTNKEKVRRFSVKSKLPVFLTLEKYNEEREKIKKERYKEDDKKSDLALIEYLKIEKKSLEVIQKRSEERRKEKAKIKKNTPNPELVRLNAFLNEILIVRDELGQKGLQTYQLYVQYINSSNLTGVGRKYLTLSKKYEELDKKFAKLYEETKKSKSVSKEKEAEFEKLLEAVDPLEQDEKSLLVEEDAVRNKTANKDQSRQAKIQKKLDEINQKQSLREKVRQDKEIQKGSFQKEKLDQEQKLKSLSEEKQRRLAKREKSDKFFSSENAFVKGASKVGGVLGSAIGGPLNAFGFDFSDEKQFLSQLFSPVTGLAKFGIGKVKSLSQKSQGIDDKSIEGLDDIFANKGLGLKKKVDLGKVSQKLNPVGGKPNKLMTGFANVKNSLGKAGGFLNPKNISNMFSRSNSNSSNTNSTNNFNSNSSSSQSNADYNRTDDRQGEADLKPTNHILDDILKELKKQTTEEKKQGGIFGGSGNSKGSKAFSLLKTVGIPGLVLGGLSYLFSKNSSDSSNVNNESNESGGDSTSVTNHNNINKSKFFKKSTSKFKNFISNSIAEGDSLHTKYGLRGSGPGISNDIMNFNGSDGTIKTPDPLRKIDSIKTIMKAETKKIEKIKDEQIDNKDLMEDLKKFMKEDFLNAFVEKFATLFVSQKGSGRSYMPSGSAF